MTAGEELPSQEKPYTWDQTALPPTEVLQLWNEVGNGIDKSQTVVWKSAVESLDHANKCLQSSLEARNFVEKYMGPIIGILVEQQPAKIGHHERNCVTESLSLAVVIVAKDLDIQIERNGECQLFNTLTHVFNKKKAFYKGNKGAWNMNHLQGLPEVRMKMIERFRVEGGFDLLQRYLLQKTGTPLFPKLDPLHQILQAVGDAIPSRPPGADQQAALKEMEEDAIKVSNAVMRYVTSTSDDALKKLPTDQLSSVQHDLQKIFDRLISNRRSSTNEFYEFWRALVLKLITSKSLPLKLFGWEQAGELIDACADHRPPPRSFIVSGAGCPFVNGKYDYAGEVTEDGYSRQHGEVSYVRKIPDKEEPGGGKKLTLFRCTMRSQQKWWFLSEADEEQPGTDRDIDYYQHKSKEHEEAFPPPSGWITCRTAGVDPPPNLEAKGLMVPEGEEFQTLEHQLAKWAIENEIVEQVLGDSTIHREVVARSTVLIKFLVSMCDRDQPSDMVTEGETPNKYCLQASHLLFAWKTCTRKADAAVSDQVYQLLVSILPDCPSSLSIPLLKAVQKSLLESQEQKDYLFEVEGFCSALAALNPVDSKNNVGTGLSENVREEVLSLLWSVLTHPDASTLKSYDSLKRYVTHELRVEPKGSEHRERFLRSCVDELAANAEKRGNSSVDEVQALRMVKLTHFVLEACPRQQADEIVMDDSGALPLLLFHELTACLERKKNGMSGAISLSRKSLAIPQSQSSGSVDLDAAHNSAVLNDRLRILRHVYGLSDPRAGANDSIVMTTEMLETLWQLCDAPDDREALMVFIASASHSGRMNHSDQFAPTVSTSNQSLQQADQVLTAAFTEQVCHSVFLNLFCSPAFSYGLLGENGYRSFQFLFKALRNASLATPQQKKTALDALWRVCLTAGKASVASQAMKDLLAVYVQLTDARRTENGQSSGTDHMMTDESDESFGERMFLCLSRVKEELHKGGRSAELSAERCLRILNAGIGQGDIEGLSMTSSTLTRLSLLPPTCTLEDAAQCIPLNLRGQACYRRIGVVAKRPQVQNQANDMSFQARDNGTGPSQQQKLPSTMRYPMDVHPLETLASVKQKVAKHCHCAVTAVKPIQINGRSAGSAFRSASGDSAHMNLNLIPEDTVMDEMGVVQGCEMVFVIAERPLQNTTALPASRQRNVPSNDLSSIFFSSEGKFADRLFDMLLGMLEALPWKEPEVMADLESDVATSTDTHKLVWDLLLAMPTNASVANRVRSAQRRIGDAPSVTSEDDAMEVDIGETWLQLLDTGKFNRSVYVLLAIDIFLQPAIETLSVLQPDHRVTLEKNMVDEASSFRRGFIDSGGFSAVAKFFSASEGDEKAKHGKTRRGNAVALRILKSCLFGSTLSSREAVVQASCEADDGSSTSSDEGGTQLLQSLSDAEGLLKSLTAMVVEDVGISSSTITDVLRFLRLLFRSPGAAQSFVSLPDGMAERFLNTLLMWDEEVETARSSSSVSAAMHVRRSAHDLILQTPQLANNALPWLINNIDRIEVSWDSTLEYFDVLEKLVADERFSSSENELCDLGTIVCKKLAACPRPTSDADLVDVSTGVLCGCLKILRALIDHVGGNALRTGTNALLLDLKTPPWSEMVGATKGVLSIVSSPFSKRPRTEDLVLVDLMGVLFDGFLSPCGSSTVAICCDKESRRRGFDVVGAAAKACKGGEGYMALVSRVNGLISSASTNLRHRWGQFGGSGESHLRTRGASKYSGLRNQGCTCYMNSVLQQIFMMHELRDSMCSAPVPACLRSSGGAASKGAELVGKKITLQWDTGVSYDAIVESFNDSTGMHTVRYCPIQVATVGGSGHHQVQPDDIAKLPPSLPDEFVLSEGRPGKETGVFELVSETSEMEGESGNEGKQSGVRDGVIKETDDEASSRHLLEEVQRTFIHLQEGSRGRCFDPRVLVEACACLKLEFDVWQQNDASEFATKLLDRLEISLKRWAPSHFHYMDHTFGLKQTKQKICKECGLKTNREEKLMNIDCQIRGKTDIHEALAAMTEVEIMEGSNKVFCDNCKKNTDTVLRTAISTLPNMLILSLKRFDLDYNTFETVKLNSRCAFGQTLNMKQYTLEGLEAMEKSGQDQDSGGPTPMDTDEAKPNPADPDTPNLSDEDYEYRLAGVLVHAGVAQGGHYYSFIRDRNPGSEEKWFRFDDEDVTPFDPSSIESECFGGKVKKETKWPNGQVHTVEQEQFANALMLFYEKVKPTDPPVEGEDTREPTADLSMENLQFSTGYDVFEPDVRRSNATHRWQSFLFDNEFHYFLKGLLGICRVTDNHYDTAPNAIVEESWRPAVIQMLLSFVFDVMLYSSDRSSLNDWTPMLEDTLLFHQQSARAFIHKLARKTKEVSGNWLRTYLLECPDQASRTASVRIFSAALKSTVSYDEERRALEAWGQAWKEQLLTRADPGAMTDEPSSMPCALEGKWQTLEDVEKLDSGGASAPGTMLSSLNTLLEALPRCWRFSAEPCLFVRDLASIPFDGGENVFRRPMVEALIPARLVALATRERGPLALRAAFPGASVSAEVANTQTRAESNPSAHVMPLSGNLNSSDMSNTRGPGPPDYSILMEAIACLAGLPGAVQAHLLRDTEEMSRGRQRYALTEAAVNALSIVFQEACAPGAPGMGQREIENHLHKCGVDTATVAPQKIVDMLSKYPTTGGNGSKGGTYLSLEGFLAYYREQIQTGDGRIRMDLQLFGFRPDLSRRSREARIVLVRGKESNRAPSEGIALDVAEIFGDRAADLGVLANNALASCLQFHVVAHNMSEPLAGYLVALSAYRHDTSQLINRALLAIYQTPCDWNGNEALHATSMVLQVIAATPGDDQMTRISQIMLSNSKLGRNVEHGAGLLHVARAWHRARQSQHYSSEIHWSYSRYMTLLKELRQIYSVYAWMTEHRSAWNFMERDVHTSGQVVPQQNQVRGEYGARDAENSIPLDHHTQSDSDLAAMNDSEDDDEDSQFENLDAANTFVGQSNEGPFQIVVEGAGNPAVNGVYNQDGYFETACRYVMDGRWNGQAYKFYIFQCNVSNNTKHWYISIVPYGGNPGTSSDIDFYTAPMSNECRRIPPSKGWVKANEGREPLPTLSYRMKSEESKESNPEGTWNGPVEEEENHEGGRSPYM